MMPDKEHIERLDEVIALKKELDAMRVERIDLEDEVNELKLENNQLRDYTTRLEGKVEAYEFCVKNGRGK